MRNMNGSIKGFIDDRMDIHIQNLSRIRTHQVNEAKYLEVLKEIENNLPEEQAKALVSKLDEISGIKNSLAVDYVYEQGFRDAMKLILSMLNDLQ